MLDLTEEFRACIVDRTIVGMLLRGGSVKMEEGRLTDETRRELAQRVLERLEAEENYDGKRHKLKTIIQRQARRVASFLRGEGRYKPFVAGW